MFRVFGFDGVPMRVSDVTRGLRTFGRSLSGIALLPWRTGHGTTCGLCHRHTALGSGRFGGGGFKRRTLATPDSENRAQKNSQQNEVKLAAGHYKNIN